MAASGTSDASRKEEKTGIALEQGGEKRLLSDCHYWKISATKVSKIFEFSKFDFC